MSSGFRIAAIGELLWDLLPDGPRLGGAPANFAAMSANLAATVPDRLDEVFLISRVGNDSLGSQALIQLRAHRVSLDYISIDPKLATGTVTVALDSNASPTYRIHENAAWDAIPETPQLAALAPSLDAICFGTLAQRSPVTRKTLRNFVESTTPGCVCVFDVNLRAPYWTAETLAWGCGCATVLKMNFEEVPLLAEALGAPAQQQAPLDAARFLLGVFPIEIIAITRGAKGSLLVTRKAAHDYPGVAAEVADTIGAGDAFAAALTYSLLRRFPLPLAAKAANRWGAWVASQRGGMPMPDARTDREWRLDVENRDVLEKRHPE